MSLLLEPNPTPDAAGFNQTRCRRLMRPKLEFLDPRQCDGWDEQMESEPGAHVFLSSAWASVLADTYDYSPCYALIRDRKRIEGMLPLMEVTSPWTGKRGVSLPFTDSCSAVVSDASVADSLFRQVVEYGKERNWRYVEFRGDGIASENAPASACYFEHRIPLLTEGMAFDRFRGEVRTAIRRAQREGVSVQVHHSRHSVEEYFKLHCLTRRRHGVPPQPWAFFQNIW